MPASASGSPILARAPATSANLGPGFDCLGLALDLWTTVRAIPGPDGEQLEPPNLIQRAADEVARETGLPGQPFELECDNQVPLARGLGSSASAIACGLLIGNAWLGNPLDSSQIVGLATRIEGHPDNVVPCLLGGIRVSVLRDGQIFESGIETRLALTAVVFIPDVTLSTERARGALPKSVPFPDALFNVSRASLLVAALTAGRVDLLRIATEDRLHQHYRAPLFPAAGFLIDAALDAGASGAYVSGAGPTVLALCSSSDSVRAVQLAFEQEALQRHVPGVTMPLNMTRQGAHLAHTG